MPTKPNPPKDVTIDVVLNLAGDPPFKLKSNDIHIDDNNHITFDNDDHDGFILHYRLTGVNNGYYFPNPKTNKSCLSDALYSARGSACPKSKGQWGQFKATDISDDCMTLTVRNFNAKGQEGEFAYTLRITNDGDNYFNLDPGGTNNNGSTGNISSYATITTTTSSFTTYAIGAVIVVVIAAIALYSAGVLNL